MCKVYIGFIKGTEDMFIIHGQAVAKPYNVVTMR